MTPQQQEEAKENIKVMDEQQYNRDLTRKTLDDIFGTRSNKYKY